MADLRGLATDAKRLYETLDYMLEKQETAKKEELDFKEIWFSAKARPFSGHILSGREPYVCKRYLVILSAFAGMADGAQNRTVQIRFLARILAACGSADMELGQLVTDGLLLEGKNIDEFQEIKDKDLQISLLIDMFLMCCLNGRPDDRQMDFAVGFMAMLGLAPELANAVGQAARGLLEQNDVLVMQQSKYLNVGNVCCYMVNPPDGVVVSSLDEARKTEADKIIFSGVTYQAIDAIDCDMFRAGTVEFRGCHFIGIHSFVCMSKKLILTDCTFEKCEVENNLMRIQNAVITGCSFVKLTTFKQRQGQYLFVMKNCKVENSVFRDIRLGFTGWWDFNGLLIADGTEISESEFLNVMTNKGAYRMMWLMSGSIFKCRISDWTILNNGVIVLYLTNGAAYSDIDVDAEVKKHSSNWLSDESSGYVDTDIFSIGN